MIYKNGIWLNYLHLLFFLRNLLTLIDSIYTKQIIIIILLLLYYVNRFTLPILTTVVLCEEYLCIPRLIGDLLLRNSEYHFFPTLKRITGILWTPLSFRPSRYLLLKRWAECNQTCYITFSRGMGVQEQHFCPVRPFVRQSVHLCVTLSPPKPLSGI